MLQQKIDTFQNPGHTQSYLVFIPLLLFQIWLAHALAFFPHEFSHSFTAWLLGWKANPLALHYGQPSVAVLLAQFGIDENVDYQPIFAAGHGWQAGIIAASGMVAGNMIITYSISRWLYAIAKRRSARNLGMFAYLFTVASLGNFWDYVPIRTFAPGGDMHTIVIGFNCSPWLVLFILGIPTAVALVYFFVAIQPVTLLWLFPGSKTKRAVMIVLVPFAIFGFYGAAGWIENAGPASKWLSIISIFAVFPLMVFYGFWRIGKTMRRAGT